MGNINEVNTKEELKDYYRKVIEENGVKFHTSKVNVERLDEFVEDLADATILDRALRTTVSSEDMADVVEVLNDVNESQENVKDTLEAHRKAFYDMLMNNNALNKLANVGYFLALLIIINILITVFK